MFRGSVVSIVSVQHIPIAYTDHVQIHRFSLALYVLVVIQSNWVYKGHLALGKVFAAGPYKHIMVRDAASSKPCGP